MASERTRPNILITGTPGTGKTTLAAAVAAASGLTHIDVGTAIREQELHCGWDEDFECHIVDDDLVRRHAARSRAGTRRCAIGPIAAALRCALRVARLRRVTAARTLRLAVAPRGGVA